MPCPGRARAGHLPPWPQSGLPARPGTATRLWRACQPPASSPPPSRQGGGCRRPNKDHCRHRSVSRPAPAPAPEYQSTPGTAHNRRSGPADRCHTGRDQALHPGQLNFAAHSRKTARPRDRKYRSVAGGQSARRPRSPSISAGRIREASTRVLLTRFRSGLGVASESGTRPDLRSGRHR